MNASSLVPDDLWEAIEPLLPKEPPKPKGGRPRVPDRAALGGIVFVLRTGCPGGCCRRNWAAAAARPAGGGCATGRKPASGSGCTRGSSTGWVTRRPSTGRRASVDSAERAGQKGGEQTGPNPVDRGKPGSKYHLVVDRNGIPLAVRLSAANAHDATQLLPLVDAIPPIIGPRGRPGRPRKRPAKLHADKAYDSADLRRALRARGITPRIARRGIDSSERLGRYRWVVERTLSWLLGCRRLGVRYERRADLLQGLLHLACALICLKFLPITT